MSYQQNNTKRSGFYPFYCASATRSHHETFTSQQHVETNSLNYPDQTKLSAQLAELYGASFGLSVRKKKKKKEFTLAKRRDQFCEW